MRRYLVAGNWKLNMGPAAGRELAQGVADLLKGRELKGDVLVCPPFVSIPAVGEVAKGDEVVTNGGLLGKITKVGESFITLELTDNVQIKVQRHAVASVMPKGTAPKSTDTARRPSS